MIHAKTIAFSMAMALIVVTGCRSLMTDAPATPRKSIPSPQPQPDSRPVTGIGILGDSSSDEYRADDNRGGVYAATTFNWLELLVQNRGLNFGPWGTWGEPRRTGYKYNWSRSGATAESMIGSGAHLGLASQVAAGEVSHVYIWIGGNDFATWNNTYANIYQGVLSDAELQAKTVSIVADLTTAVDTLLKAGPVSIVIVTLIDRGIAPDMVTQFPDAAKRQRVTDAVNFVNDGIRTMAAARHDVAVVDGNAFALALRDRIDPRGNLLVGDQSIDLFGYGNEPHSGRLNDDDGHAGTVVSGLFANILFLEPFNRVYGTGIAPLSDAEILRAAGLATGP